MSTKARTAAQKRAQRRKARAQAITLPGGETAPQRPTGRDRRHTNQRADPADAVALAVRARLTGCSVEEARDVLAASDMGRCVRAMIPADRDRRELFGAWQAISAAKRQHDLRIIGADPNPQSAAIAMMPDAMQTDTGHSVDLRTAEERDEAARRVWYRWLELLMALPGEQRHALRGHLDGYAAPLWDADELRPTRTGALAVKALRVLHEASRT
jgi:choline dehydrogenase-like flavoprotein